MSYIKTQGWYVYSDGERMHIWTSRTEDDVTAHVKDCEFVAGVAMPMELFDELVAHRAARHDYPCHKIEEYRTQAAADRWEALSGYETSLFKLMGILNEWYKQKSITRDQAAEAASAMPGWGILGIHEKRK